MTAETLVGYGMDCIGSVRLVDNRFVIRLTNPKAAEIEKSIYAFVVGDEILRVGSCKGILKTRLRAWENDVSNAFAGRSFRTPRGEAEIWKSSLMKHGEGKVFARKGSVVKTPVGELNLYLAEESTLIARHKPRCCNDVRRHK